MTMKSSMSAVSTKHSVEAYVNPLGGLNDEEYRKEEMDKPFPEVGSTFVPSVMKNQKTDLNAPRDIGAFLFIAIGFYQLFQ